jgi:hypothetical protein
MQGDAAFSVRIRRAALWCPRCGANPGFEALECAHVYPRRFSEVRHDDQNALGMCGDCHRWWHDHPKEAIAWFVKLFPDRAEYLIAKTGVRLKWMP